MDETKLIKWKNSSKRTDWHESGAFERFLEVEGVFPGEKRDRTRVGALLIQEMRGLEGLHPWMAPIEGYPKLLSPKSRVELFTRDGASVFIGPWGEAPKNFIDENEEFFIWVEGRVGAVPPPKDWKTKVLGAWRWILYRVKGGGRNRRIGADASHPRE